MRVKRSERPYTFRFIPTCIVNRPKAFVSTLILGISDMVLILYIHFLRKPLHFKLTLRNCSFATPPSQLTLPYGCSKVPRGKIHTSTNLSKSFLFFSSNQLLTNVPNLQCSLVNDFRDISTFFVL